MKDCWSCFCWNRHQNPKRSFNIHLKEQLRLLYRFYWLQNLLIWLRCYCLKLRGINTEKPCLPLPWAILQQSSLYKTNNNLSSWPIICFMSCQVIYFVTTGVNFYLIFFPGNSYILFGISFGFYLTSIALMPFESRSTCQMCHSN